MNTRCKPVGLLPASATRGSAFVHAANHCSIGMNRRYLFVALVLVAVGLFLSLPLHAQTVESDTMALTVEQSIAIMLERSPALHASMMKVEAAASKASETSTYQWPALKGGATYTRLSSIPPAAIGPFPPFLTNQVIISEPVLDNYNFRLTLQQPLFTGFKLQGDADAADNIHRSSKEEYSRDKADLIYATKSAYWSLYKSREVKRVIDENVRQLQEHVRNVRDLFDQGVVTKNEVLAAEVNLSDAKVRQIAAANNLQLALIGFNSTIGIALHTSVRLEDEATPRGPVMIDADSAISVAMAVRPEIKRAEYVIGAAEGRLTAARSTWYPQVYLFANYYYARPNQRIFPNLDQFKETWDVGVSAIWDIWNWGAVIHRGSEAEAQLSLSRDELKQVRDRITLEVTETCLALRESAERIGVSTQGVAQAEENYRITNEKFKAGTALNAELLDAEVALLSARWTRIQALVDHELAVARLERALGGSGLTRP